MSENSKDKNKYLRSIELLKNDPEYRGLVEGGNAGKGNHSDNSWSRRKFLAIMGASMAMAGLSGCRRPEEAIVPYVKPPEEFLPGVPEYYATTMPFGANNYGIVVESDEGKPTKIEGNEKHPSTKGASNVWIMASILGLYDPDRSQRVVHDGAESSWDEFVNEWRDLLNRYRGNKGRGLAVLSESFASPSLYRLAEKFKREFPEANWSVYEPVSDENIYVGIQGATGKQYQPVYHLDKADVILSLDSDFTNTESENIRNAAGFADGRRLNSKTDKMNRLYIVESTFTATGSMADHRMRLQARQIGDFLTALTIELTSQGLEIKGYEYKIEHTLHRYDQQWIAIAAKDLMANKGRSLIMVGRNQPPQAHALAFAINEALGNFGETVEYHEIKDTYHADVLSLQKLSVLMNSGSVETLVMLGGNPAYNSPVDIHFSEALKKIETSIHLSLYTDETSAQVNWHIPQAHYLESWGDCRAADGTLSVTQPLINPLFGGHSMLEFLNLIVTGEDEPGDRLLKENWKDILKGRGLEDNWRKALHDGIYGEDDTKPVEVTVNEKILERFLQVNRFSKKRAHERNLEIAFRPCPKVFDGRFANNAWLQELPDPVTKLAWDNAALISPETARTLDLKNEQIAILNYKEREIRIPVWIVPGMPDFSFCLSLGYGRKSAGVVGTGVGVDVYGMRTTRGSYFDMGLAIGKSGKKRALANTQDHWSMEDRPIVREATHLEYRQNPEFAKKMVEHPPLKSLWEEHKYDKGYQWGMVIDLTTCTGCNACVTACQSENNIVTVGKEQVIEGREMHWIRIDRYFNGSASEPQMVFQPMPCQQCENAPCEGVCPVAATVHDEEGLNVMTYNRCIGTRYCSNNCPYKVRRFNFFNYVDNFSETHKMAQNPDVTVRSRGVMEKCTYCVQRISRAKIDAKNAGRELADGEVRTACQQACPTNAITFGNINDPDSEITKLKKRDREYKLLAELNIKPRTSYLAKIRNPNPEMEIKVERPRRDHD
ncbi:MAG: 4Fe-4S dicluster domain-containing protein [candidate division Zixibacteria bacterium]|nr:4Fe-4S dicluster domain-containing protein [candidate division Zixibacteria bacterium]